MNRDFGSTEFLEVAAHVGCPIRCTPYCPQDRMIKSGGDGPRLLCFSDYRKLLSSVPKNVAIAHAGVSEPFMNPEIVDMIRYADEKGHKQAFYTTLFNASPQQIRDISHIDFEMFLVHLPDGLHAKIPYSQRWAESLYAVATWIPSASYMSMNDNFVTCKKEDFDENNRLKFRFRQWGFCIKLHMPQMLVYPNGNVYPCCMLFDDPVMGNLFKESYSEIRSRLLRQKMFAPCHRCTNYLSLTRAVASRVARFARKRIWKM